jgi:hypothetical protein
MDLTHTERTELKRFLVAANEANCPASPSAAIDLLWHRALADIGAYETWCTEEVGLVVTHSSGGRRNIPSYLLVRELAESASETLDERTWPTAESVLRHPSLVADCTGQN